MSLITFDGFEHIFDYLDTADLVHAEVKWRWWKLPDGELTRDFSRGRTGSIDGLYTRQPLPSPTSGLISGSIGISSRGAGGSGGASSSASSSRAPSPGGFGFASFSSTPTRAGAAAAASPKRITLGRIGKVAFPVPMSYFGAKSEYLRRIQLDKDVAILFRMLQSPPFHAIAATYLSDVGMEGRDKLDRLANVDLTHQYYYNAVIREVNEANMVKHFKVMVEHDDNYEVEDGLIVVAKWANPFLDVDALRGELRSICGLVRDKLVEEGLVVYSASDDSIMHCSSSMLPALGCVNRVLFDTMGFKGNVQDYYDPKNSYMDEVLSRRLGLPITLSVLYAVVCRSVDIPIEMIGMPAKFIVKYAAPASSREPETFLDPFEGGRFLSRAELQDILLHIVPDNTNPDYLRAIRNRDVWARVIRNLINVFKERVLLPELCGAITLLLCIDGPDALAQRTLRMQTCQMMEPPRHGMVLQDIEFLKKLQADGDLPAQINAMMQAQSSKFAEIQAAYNDHIVAFQAVFNSLRMNPNTPLPGPSARNTRVRSALPGGTIVAYRVGQCVGHRLHRYRAVVVGWDVECAASEKWIETMQVDRLPRGRKQPFYKLIVDCRDRQSPQPAYVAEENVMLLAGFNDHIQHPELGRYFTHCTLFPSTCYHPNAFLRQQFPEDVPITEDTVCASPASSTPSAVAAATAGVSTEDGDSLM